MLLRLLQGVWTKTAIGDWRFESSSVYLGETLLVRENETYEDLTNMVRARLMLNQTTPLVLTYQLPQWMLVPEGNNPPPPSPFVPTTMLRWWRVLGFTTRTLHLMSHSVHRMLPNTSSTVDLHLQLALWPSSATGQRKFNTVILLGVTFLLKTVATIYYIDSLTF